MPLAGVASQERAPRKGRVTPREGRCSASTRTPQCRHQAAAGEKNILR